MLYDAATPHRNGHAIIRKAMNEIGGTIYWINDPDHFWITIVYLATFFGKNAMIRISATNGLNDILFGSLVDIGY